jgi:hypothetical protein
VKIGRNQPCLCGSGKKFKRCHGRLGQAPPRPPVPDIKRLIELQQGQERIRQAQQGEGRPIISLKSHDNQMVAVGNTLHWSKTWKTFVDFLSDYMKRKLGSDWGNAEIAKPLAERHTIMQWYDAWCRQQAKHAGEPGEVRESAVTGVVACYLGVAYGLYLLDHNVELQDCMIQRLKDAGQFQGAYYELMVASALIRAGFELTLEDETNPNAKHCEFAAVSKATGKKYWIEAKMRAVVGLLGRTAADGTTSPNPISHMVRHLNGALGKPAADERMIFIDVNTEMPFDVSDENRPPFVAVATRRLERYEQKELKKGESAYVFVTNMNFHRDLEARAQLAAFPFGLGMPDFNRPAVYRLSERYKHDKKHADALKVAEGWSKLLRIPTTFDGSLPNVTLGGERPPIIIGERYNFEGAGPNGKDLLGMVADATVVEAEKVTYVVVNAEDGTSCILKEPMTDGQINDYKAHPDAYFGRVVRPQKRADTPYELFEFFMYAYRELSREELLKRLAGRVPDAAQMPDDELLAIYCEGMVSASGMFKVMDGVIQT